MAYELVGVRPPSETDGRLGVQSIGSPIVGRDSEVASLAAYLDRLMAGQGSIVSIVGEAGVGKSRLLAEARRRLANHDVCWLEGAALSFGQTISYWPFLQVLRGYAGITEHDTESESWTKLEQRLIVLFDDEVDEVLPYLATLLGLEVRGALAERVTHLDSEAVGLQLFRTARRFFARVAEQGPAVLVFDDVHWLDESSAALLEHLLPLAARTPLLVCFLTRPDPDTSGARLREMAQADHAACYTEISLEPLSPSDCVELLNNLVGQDELAPRVRELILDRAEGNPFFVEEVLRWLLESRRIVRDNSTGRYQVTGPLDQIMIPDTLQGLIMARLDRLDGELKEVLRTAAVIGRSFLYRVLRAITESGQELDHHLAQLQELELIHERQHVPELEYMFKHALTQEATYESMLLQRRRDVHRQVAECIETLFGEHLEDFYPLLAYDYTRAEDWPRAQEYLLKAGDQAARVAADAEALAHYQHALVAYTRAFGERWDPLQRATLERKIGEALFRRGQHQEAREHLERAVGYLGYSWPTSRWGLRWPLARAVIGQVAHRLLPRLLLGAPTYQGNPLVEERARINDTLFWISYFLMDRERLAQTILVGLNLCERHNVTAGICASSAGMGTLCDSMSLVRLAGYYHRRALRLAEELQHPLLLGYAAMGLGFHALHGLGQAEAALAYFRRAAAAHRDAGALREWGGATCAMLYIISYTRGGFAEELDQCRELVRVGQDAADQLLWGWGLVCEGSFLAAGGQLEAAIGHLQAGIALLKSVPDYVTLGTALAMLGQTYLLQDKLPEALAALEEAEQVVVEHGVSGFLCTSVYENLADAYLTAAAQADPPERADILRKCQRACKAALAQTRVAVERRACAYRLQGTFEWLCGNHHRAQAWWQRSLQAAETLGANYDLARTYLDMGRRLAAPRYLQSAERIFGEIGSAAYQAQVQDLLAHGVA